MLLCGFLLSFNIGLFAHSIENDLPKLNPGLEHSGIEKSNLLDLDLISSLAVEDPEEDLDVSEMQSAEAPKLTEGELKELKDRVIEMQKGFQK